MLKGYVLYKKIKQTTLSLCMITGALLLATPAWSHVLVENVQITSVEQLLWTAAEQAVFVTYKGDDRRCLSRNEQRVTFRRVDAGGNEPLLRISNAALYALETGTTVTIVGNKAGDCASASGIILGVLPPELQPPPVPVDPAGPPKILSQKTIQMDEDTTLELLPSHFNLQNAADAQLKVKTGTSYTIVGNVIKPAANFPNALPANNLIVPVTVISGGQESEVFNAKVTVNNVNDAPKTIAPWTYTIKKNTSGTIWVSGFFCDPDGCSDFSKFTYQFVDARNSTNGLTANGQVSATADPAGFTYKPKRNFVGLEAIQLWVTDAGGLQSAPTTVYFDVTN